MKKTIMLSLAAIAFWAVAAFGQPSPLTNPPAGLSSAETVALQIPNTSGVIAGDVIEIPITFTGSLEGLGILSYQLHLTYNQNILAIAGLKKEGTASESMTTILGNEVSPGNYYIAAAGTTPIEGESPLLILEVELLSSGSTNLGFGPAANNYFNEGNPGMTTTNGWISITARPSISVFPSSPVLARGDEQVFTVSTSAVAPVQWSVSDESIATISQQGVLTATGFGSLQVFATDANDVSGQTNPFTVHPFRLTAEPVEQYQGLAAAMSVQVTSLDDLEVLAGSFAIQHWAIESVVTGVSVDMENTMLAGADVVTRLEDNRLEVAFASSTVLEGGGELMRLIFYTADDQVANTTLQFTDVVFNQDLSGHTVSFPFRIQAPPPLQVTVSPATVMSGQTLTFAVQGHQGEVAWSVDDPRLGTIDGSGVFSAVTGGKTRITAVDAVGARGSSPEISIYDYNLRIEPITAVRGQPVRIPVTIDNTEAAVHEVVSMEGELVLPDVFENPTVELTDGILNGWLLSQNKEGNVIHFALAGSDAVESDGPLLYIAGTLRNDLTATTYLFQIRNIVMNEGEPVPRLWNDRLRVLSDYPLPPSLIQPPNLETNVPTAVAFTWGSVSGATSYRFELSLDDQFPPGSTHAEILSGTRLDIDTLSIETTYYWRVKTIINQVASDWSEVWHFTTIVPDPPPDPPDQVVLDSPEDESESVPLDVTFTWHPVDRADYYVLQVATDLQFSELLADTMVSAGEGNHSKGMAASEAAAMEAAAAANVVVMSLDVSDLFAEATTYWWRVQGIGEGGEGPWSEVWRFTTIVPDPPPDPPDQVVLDSPEDESESVPLDVTFTWHPVDRADYYVLQVGLDLQFSQMLVDTTVTTGGGIKATGMTTTEATANLVVESLDVSGLFAEATTYWWRVQGIGEGGEGPWSEVWHFTTLQTTGGAELADLPDRMYLHQNYPNPFNPVTTIGFELHEPAEVILDVYDMLGRRVAVLLNTRLTAGKHQVVFQAEELPTGIYIYRLQSGEKIHMRKMTLMK